MKALTAEQLVALTTPKNYDTAEITIGFCKKVAKKLKENYNISSKLTFDDFYDFHCKYPRNVEVGSHVTIKVEDGFLKEIRKSLEDLTTAEKNYVREVWEQTN